ncbi:SURF1 family cytochrome oxidase biogenesis protein [Microbacterium sp. GXF7504]
MTARQSPARRWTAYILVAVVFAVACGFLSHWQFSRNADRAAQLALVEANYDAAPIALDAAVTGLEDFDPAYEWHPVELHGEYLLDEQLVVRNRPHGGTSAFEVLTPFRLDDGRILVVNRGWVEAAESGDGPVTIPSPAGGAQTVVVRLRQGEPLPSSGRSAPEGQVPTINVPLIADTVGGETVRSVYGIMVSEDPAATELPNRLDSPSDDPGPFLSYAVQWILFAVMGFVFIWYVIRSERRARLEDAEDEAAGIPAAPTVADVAADAEPVRAPKRRRTRRPDRDMQDEDALLDRADR